MRNGSATQPTRSWNMTLVAVLVLSAIATDIVLTAPGLASALVARYHLRPGQLGWYFTAEIGGMSLASLPAFWCLSRCPMKTLIFGATSCLALADMASGFVADYRLLLVLRFIASLSAGFTMVLCMTASARLPHRESAFGLNVSAQLVFAAASLLAYPSILKMWGLPAIYFLLGIMMLISIPLCYFMDDKLLSRIEEQRITIAGWRIVLILCFVGLFYAAVSGDWTFAGRLASASGIGASQSDGVLSLSSLFGITGGILATVASFYVPARILLSVSVAATGVASLALLGYLDVWRFAVASCAFRFFWTFAVPFMLARVSRLIPSLYCMCLVNLTAGAGFALGPLISGWTIDLTGYSSTMIVLNALLLAIATLGLIRGTSPAPEAG